MNNSLAHLSLGMVVTVAVAVLSTQALAQGSLSQAADPQAAPFTEPAGLPCPYPQPVGLIGFSQSVGNRALGIDIEGDVAYVGDWHQGSHHAYAGVLQAFDISDPCYPHRLEGWVETNDPGRNEIGDVAVHGSRAYVANDGNGFAVYDVSDPSDPLLLGRRNDATYAHSVFYQGGDYAYVGYGWSHNRELAIYNVATLPLNAPVIYPIGTGGLHDIYVDGNRGFILSGQQFDIVDLTDPSYPTRISTLPLPQHQYGVEGEVRRQGDYVFLAMGDADHFGGLRVVDVSNETSPTLIAQAQYDIPGGAGKMWAKGIGLAVSGNRAYIAARAGLWVFDISDPHAPMIIDNFALPAEFVNSMGAHVEVRDGLAYVTAYGVNLNPSVGGLAVYKVHELPYAVEIDIKPGSDPNSINLCSHGAVPVAILGSDAFNVDWIDTDTLRFAEATVKVVGKKDPHSLCSKELVNDDYEYDLVCHFITMDIAGIDGEATSASVNGELFDGSLIHGTDSVNIVKDSCPK